MTDRGATVDALRATASNGARHWRNVLERGLLLVLLSLIPLRTVLAETHSFEVPRWFRSLPPPPGAQPATTCVFIAIILAAAAAWCWLQASRQGRHYRRTGAEVGALVLLAAAIISTSRASQKHLALIGALDFLAQIVYMLILRQLLTRPWHIHLCLAVIMGAGAMSVAKCAFQYWVEWPQTVAYYEEHKAEFMPPAPADAEDASTAGLIHDYERRLYSRMVTGYSPHSNVLGSQMILVILAGLAVAASRYWRRSWPALLVPSAIAVAGMGAMILARSKGAVAAIGAALAVWALWEWLTRRARRRAANANSQADRSPMFSTRQVRKAIIVLALAAVCVLGLAATATVKPQVLGASMLYRVMYWRGAWKMLVDRGPWGIGPGNFGRLFPRYKPVECPEDVDAPHSWVVQAATEWGVLGLAGMVILLAGAAWYMLRPAPAPAEQSRPPPNPWMPDAPALHKATASQRRPGSILLWSGGLTGILMAGVAYVLRDAEPGYASIVLAVALVPWLTAFLAVSVETGRSRTFADDLPGRLLVAGLCAGLLGFVLHTSIDLAMFWPGAATAFFAVLAVVLAIRDSNGLGAGLAPANCATSVQRAPSGQADRTPKGQLGARRRYAAIAFGLCASALTIVVLLRLALPAAQLNKHLRDARLGSGAASWDTFTASSACKSYNAAIRCYRYDATAVGELAEELSYRITAVRHADEVIPLLDEFRRRDPENEAVWHRRAAVFARCYAVGGDPSDLQRAIDAAGMAVAAQPASPTARLRLAQLLENQAKSTDSADARREAASELRTALDLDARRIYVSKPHRFTTAQRAAINARIERLLAAGAPATDPANR